MATWNSRGLRGSTLEDLINRTNEQYAGKKLALIQKIPTPITPVRMDKENRHITLAYFEQRSTVDYIGAVQGIPVCFDAKECSVDTFPLSNIHPHQVEFMNAFEQQGGIAFFLIFFIPSSPYPCTFTNSFQPVSRPHLSSSSERTLLEHPFLLKKYKIIPFHFSLTWKTN